MVMWNRASTQLRTYKRWFSSDSTRRTYAALWGNGDFGRLGLGNLDSQWRPRLLPPSAFGNHGLKSIACGGAHTLFLTETGRVYATGLNDFGQLGISGNDNYTMEPIEVSGLKKEAVQISAGYHHSCAITADGELYMWGRNSNGQLGLGKKGQSVVPLPTKVECLSGLTIKMVALASEHSIGVTVGGEALSWGGGGSGQLGHGNQSSILGFLRSTSEYTPRRITKLEGVKVKNVAAGFLHSACVDANGSIFVFGERAIGRLVVENCMLGDPTKMVALVSVLLTPFIYQKELKVLFQDLRLKRSPVVGSTQLQFLATSTPGVGEVLMDHFLKMGILLADNCICIQGHGSDVDYGNPTMVTFEKNVKALQVSCGFNHTGAILESAET
ncbi:ultraviolet-B receptor UVR8 isoform X4 [Hevea brasiliensis]|uniref:ultraviolet-B receptor UVR8 isoform X4 n=1 Tax=Hevea brasiliensis TaxID=3981 RepID=UPI002600AC9F|nr:ultraviolet-B receptor UVR8 isoform X4 [Hevea brasiliensis]